MKLAIGNVLLFASIAAHAGILVDEAEMNQYLQNIQAAYPQLDVDACAVVKSETQESTNGASNFDSEMGYLKVDCSAAAVASAASGPGRPGFFARLFGHREGGFRGSVDRKNRKFFRSSRMKRNFSGCRVGRR